jgi:O-antigen/teichoic acid export membrane protein
MRPLTAATQRSGREINAVPPPADRPGVGVQVVSQPAAVVAPPSAADATTALGRRDRLARFVGWSAAAQLLPLAVTAVLTPFVVRHLGLDRYGVWALLLSAVGILTAIDGGIAQSLLRFVALRRGAGDDAAAARIAVAGLLLLLVVAVPGGALLWWAGPALLQLGRVPAALHGDAVGALRAGVALLALTLLAASAGAVLQAYERFRATAVIAIASQLVNVVLVVMLVERGDGLAGLLAAATAAAAVSAVLTLGTGWRHLRPARGPGWRADVRQLVRFGSRIQATGLTGLINLEADALVIAAFLPIRDVGVYALGASVATALRNAPLWGLPPLIGDLAHAAGSPAVERAPSDARPGGPGAVPSAVATTYRTLQRRWVRFLAVYAAAACVTAPVATYLWVGGHWPAAVVAGVLTAGNMVNLTTGVTTGLTRAIGRPGLETRYAVLVTVVNLALTVPLAATLGLYGVVAATAVGQALGSSAFARIVRRHTDLDLGLTRQVWRPRRTAVVLVLTGLAEAAVSRSGLHGAVGLVAAGAVFAVAVGLGLGLRPGAVRRLLPSG